VVDEEKKGGKKKGKEGMAVYSEGGTDHVQKRLGGRRGSEIARRRA